MKINHPGLPPIKSGLTNFYFCLIYFLEIKEETVNEEENMKGMNDVILFS